MERTGSIPEYCYVGSFFVNVLAECYSGLELGVKSCDSSNLGFYFLLKFYNQKALNYKKTSLNKHNFKALKNRITEKNMCTM